MLIEFFLDIKKKIPTGFDTCKDFLYKWKH